MTLGGFGNCWQSAVSDFLARAHLGSELLDLVLLPDVCLKLCFWSSFCGGLFFGALGSGLEFASISFAEGYWDVPLRFIYQGQSM